MVGERENNAALKSAPNVSISSPSSEGGGLLQFLVVCLDMWFPLVLLQAKVVGLF